MKLAAAVQRMLEENIIPFWLSLKDERYGGFISYVDLDLRRDPKAEKGCILNSRILWFFSEAAMLLRRSDLRSAADHAYRFLMCYCMDRKAGGVYWSVTYDGKPLDTTKHTYLHEPWKVIAEPSGYFLAPLGEERIGDVSNVVFTNGAIVRPDGTVYIYYASSDTRLHVATTDIKRLLDYAFHTPGDPLRSADCVKQRCDLIEKNLEFMRQRQMETVTQMEH